MKSRVPLTLGLLVAGACSAHGGFDTDGGPSDASQDGLVLPGDSGFGDSPTGDSGPGVTTVYAHTDTTLYTLDPQSDAITMIGNFVGTSDSGTDGNVTDLAVNSAGDVYVNTESVIYKAAIPASPPAPVQLTKLASIALQSGQQFYALAFTPPNAIDPNEILIGGDGYGELYAIDTSSGATRDLGHFGTDPSHSGYDFALSGDLVFYMDGGNATGLATVRPCKPKSTNCMTSDDYLVAVDMSALANAYKTSTPAASLLKGIYGGSGTADGPGTGYGDLFGLGAWEGSVFAFARKTAGNGSALLLTISPTTGQGTVVSSSFSFTNGWSGAGVTTSATITVPLPN